MKRFASHYFLRPDGTLGSYPVVEVNADGVIQSVVEYGSSFTETAGVSFFGGIMLPGFIGLVGDGELFTHSYIRKCGLDGYLRFVCSGATVFSDVRRVFHRSEKLLTEVQPLPAFESRSDFEALVTQLTLERTQSLGVYPRWGVLKQDASPGIMVVEGIELKNFRIVSPLRYRILVP